MPSSLAVTFVAAVSASPLGVAPSAHGQALAIWAAAYEACYAPAHFSMEVDKPLTVRCIERALREARAGASEALKAPLDGLLRETPRLLSALNAQEDRKPAAARAGKDAKPRAGRAAGAAHPVDDAAPRGAAPRNRH